jgi:hypothetical protein
VRARAAFAAAVPNERQVQRGILRMAGVCFRDVFITHIPNGAHLAGSDHQRRIQGGKLVGDGMKRGFPDLLCLWAPAKGCLIEVKRPGGKAEAHQAELHARLRALGWPVETVDSVDDAYRFLRDCGAPQSATLGIDVAA